MFSTGVKATHFSGPVVCGPPNQTAVPSAALLSLNLQLDFSMGNFNLQLPFPPGALVFAVATVLCRPTPSTAPRPAAPTVSIGTATGLSDIFAVALPTTANAVKNTLTSGNNIPANCAAWLSVSGNTANVTGEMELAVLYIPPFQKWS